MDTTMDTPESARRPLSRYWLAPDEYIHDLETGRGTCYPYAPRVLARLNDGMTLSSYCWRAWTPDEPNRFRLDVMRTLYLAQSTPTAEEATP